MQTVAIKWPAAASIERGQQLCTRTSHARTAGYLHRATGRLLGPDKAYCPGRRLTGSSEGAFHSEQCPLLPATAPCSHGETAEGDNTTRGSLFIYFVYLFFGRGDPTSCLSHGIFSRQLILMRFSPLPFMICLKSSCNYFCCWGEKCDISTNNMTLFWECQRISDTVTMQWLTEFKKKQKTLQLCVSSNFQVHRYYSIYRQEDIEQQMLLLAVTNNGSIRLRWCSH